VYHSAKYGANSDSIIRGVPNPHFLPNSEFSADQIRNSEFGYVHGRSMGGEHTSYLSANIGLVTNFSCSGPAGVHQPVLSLVIHGNNGAFRLSATIAPFATIAAKTLQDPSRDRIDPIIIISMVWLAPGCFSYHLVRFI
jgi:hypothetical protein